MRMLADRERKTRKEHEDLLSLFQNIKWEATLFQRS